MEDTLRVGVASKENRNGVSLNPCFNGRYSQSLHVISVGYSILCLNPCFNGRYSQRAIAPEGMIVGQGLNPCFNGRYSQRY